MTAEISQNDIIRLFLQFALESGLNATFKTLQEESGIGLNCIDSIDLFKSDIRHGKWEIILKRIKNFTFPASKLFSLYEEIVLELLEVKDTAAALIVFREGIIGSRLQKELPQKSVDLEYLIKNVQNGNFPLDKIYGTSNKEVRRAEIAESLGKEVEVVEPSRLIELLSQSMRFQISKGQLIPNVNLNIFNGQYEKMEETDRLVNSVEKAIKLPDSTRINTLVFSPNGQFFITGSQDGIIEVWDALTMVLNTDLAYQASEKFMFHKAAITSLTLTKDSSLLASGDKAGDVKVWLTPQGKCLKRLEGVHIQSVTSLCFGNDVSHLITAAFEIKVFGLKSSRVIKTFQGHTGIVNSLILLDLESGSVLVSGSADGTIRTWNYNSLECINLVDIPGNSIGNCIHEIKIMSKEFMIFANSTSSIGVLNNRPPSYFCKHEIGGPLTSITSVCSSAHGSFLYAADRKGIIYNFNTKTKKWDVSTELNTEILGMEMNPTRNSIVVYTMNGQLIFLSN